MATTEELTVLIRTVGDTTGAQQVSQALQKTQQSASQTQQQLTSGQQGANTLLRALVERHGTSLEAFEKARESVTRSTGVAPTLLPRDFGIQAAQAAQAARATAEATKAVGGAANVTGNEVLRMGAAFVGAGIGLSAFTAAGQAAHATISSMITQTVGLDQATRANAAALGAQATGFQAWAQIVSQSAGVTQQSLLEAGTTAEQFRRQVGVGPEAVQQLTLLATALGQIRGEDAGQTMSLLTSAMQGNAQAANTLGLQLDAASLAYARLGGSTADVFNALDPAAQATLRFAAANEQAQRQLAQTTGPVQDLYMAQSRLNTAWERFTQSYGPGVIGMLGGIIDKAGGALDAVNKLNAITIERNKQVGGDEGFKNEQAVLEGIGQRLDAATSRLRGELGQDMSDLGTGAKALNDQLRDTTGFDAQATAANVATAAAEKAQQAIDAVGQTVNTVKDAAANLGDALTAPFVAAARAADSADRAAASTRSDQLRSLAGQIAGPAAVREAALQNEIAANQELDRLRNDSLSLTANEAQIRLSMLPTQQRLVELQLEANRAQLEATQRSLPAARALEDLNAQVERQRLIASSGSRSIQERSAAAATGAGLGRQLPEAQLAALDARLAGVPAARRVQDVGLEAQQFGLNQQQALQGLEYARLQTGWLQQIAEAAYSSASRTFNLSIASINAIIQSSGLTITENDIARIGASASDAVIAAFHQGVQKVNGNTPNPNVLAAGTP